MISTILPIADPAHPRAFRNAPGRDLHSGPRPADNVPHCVLTPVRAAP